MCYSTLTDGITDTVTPDEAEPRCTHVTAGARPQPSRGRRTRRSLSFRRRKFNRATSESLSINNKTVSRRHAAYVSTEEEEEEEEAEEEEEEVVVVVEEGVFRANAVNEEDSERDRAGGPRDAGGGGGGGGGQSDRGGMIHDTR